MQANNFVVSSAPLVKCQVTGACIPNFLLLSLFPLASLLPSFYLKSIFCVGLLHHKWWNHAILWLPDSFIVGEVSLVTPVDTVDTLWSDCDTETVDTLPTELYFLLLSSTDFSLSLYPAALSSFSTIMLITFFLDPSRHVSSSTVVDTRQ